MHVKNSDTLTIDLINLIVYQTFIVYSNPFLTSVQCIYFHFVITVFTCLDTLKSGLKNILE